MAESKNTFLDRTGLSHLLSKLSAEFAKKTHVHNPATQTTAGMQSPEDKQKLDNLATVATTGSYTDLLDKPTAATIGAAKTGHKHTATDINSGTFSSDRFPVIPVTKGGTGASNSSQARANLGIAEEYWVFTLEDGTTVTKLVCAT